MPEATDTRTKHIRLIQAGRAARAERLDPAAIARYELRQTTVTGTPTIEPKGWVGDCYHASFSPKELRQPKPLPAYTGLDEPKRGPFVHYRNIDGEEIRLVSIPSPAIHPSQVTFDADEERPALDTDDPFIIQAARRYEGLQRRAALVKQRFDGERRDEMLLRLRGEWRDVEWETGVSFAEAESEVTLRGREGDARIRRERAEVAYCHRDPSDWQVRAEQSQFVQESLRVQKALADMDATMTEEDRADLNYIFQLQEAVAAFHAAWNRHFAHLGEDAPHGRLVETWEVEINGKRGADWWLKYAPAATRKTRRRYIRPLATIGRDEFVARKIAEKGDTLAGFQAAINSLRFRIVKNRERSERRKAA